MQYKCHDKVFLIDYKYADLLVDTLLIIAWWPDLYCQVYLNFSLPRIMPQLEML